MTDPSQPQPTPENEPLVWIVVLHYQGPEHTIACLESLRQCQWRKTKILLADNGSPDNSGADIAARYPEFSFLKIEENLGFAGGSNAAIKYCIDRGAEWVWLLNNDTLIKPDCLQILMQRGLNDPKAGALGAVVYAADGTAHLSSGIGEIDYRRAKTLMRKAPPQDAQTVACAWISGSNLLLRTQAFEAVSGFDERYFLYFEDTDLCVRLRQAGFTCLLVPAAAIEHVGGASTEGKFSTWRSYYYTRNRFLFFLTMLRGLSAVPALLAIYGHLLRHILVLPFRGTNGKRQLKAELLATSDYHHKRLGKATCLDW
jgi:GT2 family glycosyltransferase